MPDREISCYSFRFSYHLRAAYDNHAFDSAG
jgi:hypothetical protein